MIPIGAAPLSPNLSRIKKCTVAAFAAVAASIIAVITVLCAPNRITISGRTSGDVSTPPMPFVLFEFRTIPLPLSESELT